MKYKAYKAFIDFEKEENWLNHMAAKGMNLVYYSFMKYIFEEGKPGEYVYRIELLKELPSHPESKAYLRFMEEAGVECVSTYFRWVYFRKSAVDGSFDIYTDFDSKIKHYIRVTALVGILGIINLLVGLFNLAIGFTVGIETGNYFNACVSILNLSIGVLSTILCFSYFKKIRGLKKEKLLRE